MQAKMALSKNWTDQLDQNKHASPISQYDILANLSIGLQLKHKRKGCELKWHYVKTGLANLNSYYYNLSAALHAACVGFICHMPGDLGSAILDSNSLLLPVLHSSP